MNSYVCFLAMLAGIKKRIAHHHQAYGNNILCKLMRIPCKIFATHWLACGEAAAINGWGSSALKKGKVTILPNAIDPERFKFSESARREIRAKYGIAEDDFVVGHVGRFYPQKNHEFLIDVFAELHKQKSNAKLLLLGDGPLQEHIKQKVESLGLTSTVIFAGLQKDVAPFYSAMDVFAFPSLWEGLPLTLVEAQYTGLPCVVGENVTKETIITNKVHVVPLSSIKPMCEELTSSNISDNREHPQINSRRFDIENCYKMLESLYQA
jgi:glycosyltransferase EpsF